MNDITLLTIENKIYEIRGVKVMLDFDLAEMYGIETGQLKRSVRRNIERFEGEDFMFELTKDEVSRCQFGTLNKTGRGGNLKYLPFAFTELGVAMLSSVLRSPTAIEINRRIMRVFTAMRQLIIVAKQSEDKIEELRRYIDEIFSDQNDINEDTRMQIELINEAIAELQVKKSFPRNPIGCTVNWKENSKEDL